MKRRRGFATAPFTTAALLLLVAVLTVWLVRKRKLNQAPGALVHPDPEISRNAKGLARKLGRKFRIYVMPNGKVIRERRGRESRSAAKRARPRPRHN
jgi:hypothetical protein